MLEYKSGKTGEIISLYSENVRGRLKKAGFYNFEWSVNEIKKLIGSTVESFGKDAKKYELTIDFVGSKSERAENANAFFEMTEADVLGKTPGKLRFKDYYLNCYIIGSESGGRDERKRMVQKKTVV